MWRRPTKLIGRAALPIALAAAWQPALADSAKSRSETSSLVAVASFSGTSDCQGWDGALELRADAESTGTAAPTRIELTSIALQRRDWCTGATLSLSVTWPNLSGVRLNESLRSASINVQRSVDVVECSYTAELESCRTRAVPLSLSAAWTARGESSASTDIHLSNLSGAAERTIATLKTSTTDVTGSISLDGAPFTLGRMDGWLSSTVARQSTTP